MNRLGQLNPGLVDAARYTMELGASYRLRPEVTSVYRSIDFQRELRRLYEQCRAGDRIACQRQPYPANQPGDSAHNWGLAWDSWVPADQMALWTDIRRAVGWRVPENDLIHAELPDWRSYVRRY